MWLLNFERKTMEIKCLFHSLTPTVCTFHMACYCLHPITWLINLYHLADFFLDKNTSICVRHLEKQRRKWKKERCKWIKADDIDLIHILKFSHLQEAKTGASWKLKKRQGKETDFVSFLRKIESQAISWQF